MNFISKITNCWKSASRADFLFWSAIILALIPWAYFRSQQATHSDMLWLCDILKRFLNGIPLAEGGYETNPPLSMLIYSVPVLAKEWLGFPLHYAIFIQTTILITASSTAIYKIMSAWQTLEKQTVQIITAGYLLAMTVGVSIYHGERDHLVALGLVPFVLAQITLTFNLPQARGWIKPVFAVGAVLILLKPHHGLIPSILLAHRAIRQRRLSVIFDPDFICLTLAVLGYAALIFTLFLDYAFIIFPDVAKLYLSNGSMKNTYSGLHWIGVFCFGLAFAATILKMKREERLIMLFFTVGAFISLIPYAVQKMGFYYHLIPVLAFLFMSLSITVLVMLRNEIKIDAVRGVLVIILMTTMSYIFAPLNIKYPDHKFFSQTPFAKLVTDCPDKEDCKFFMLNREMGILHETAYYTNTSMVSRFASPWFMRSILDTYRNNEKGINGPLTPAEYNYYINRFAKMSADDLNRHKPQHVIIWEWKSGPEEGFVALLSINKDFADAMKAYQKKGPFHIDYKDYYRVSKKRKSDVVEYTVYERKPGK